MLFASTLAVAAALTYGSADFLGGSAARRSGPVPVALVAQVAGFLVLLPLLLLSGVRPGPAALGWGLAAGVAGGLGLALFFRALVSGLMALVAPLTAVLAAFIPLAGGLVQGERPTAVAAAGVGLVAAEPGSGRQGAGGRGLGLAFLAGAGFGLFFLCLARAPRASGWWPVVGARVGSVLVIGAVLLVVAARGARPIIARGGLRLALVSGVLDVSANAMFLLAVRRGSLSLVAVLTSLYPAVTVVLSLLVLRERLRASQLVGIGAALVAIILIASG